MKSYLNIDIYVTSVLTLLGSISSVDGDCPSYQVTCPDGSCKARKSLCYYLDETPECLTRGTPAVLCDDGKNCYHPKWASCDGVDHCPDGTDEKGCGIFGHKWKIAIVSIILGGTAISICVTITRYFCARRWEQTSPSRDRGNTGGSTDRRYLWYLRNNSRENTSTVNHPADSEYTSDLVSSSHGNLSESGTEREAGHGRGSGSYLLRHYRPRTRDRLAPSDVVDHMGDHVGGHVSRSYQDVSRGDDVGDLDSNHGNPRTRSCCDVSNVPPPAYHSVVSPGNHGNQSNHRNQTPEAPPSYESVINPQTFV